MKHIKNIRLGNYDYSQNGYYFVTVCSYLKQPVLETNKAIIKKCIKSLDDISGVTIDYCVTMSNHVHIILILENCRMKLGEVVRRFKATASRKTGIKLWQPNYYEHVIRNEDALFKIREYITNNPEEEKIKFEEFYPQKRQ
jgi:putative transposase